MCSTAHKSTAFEKEIENACETLSAGGTLLYPTATIWGIGCDATQPSAIDKIRKIKQRPRQKSFILLLSQKEQLAHYVKNIPQKIDRWLNQTSRPLTIIYPNARHLPSSLIASDGSIGIRLTPDPFCQQLINRINKPLVSTSANISGSPSPKNFQEVASPIKNAVDYCVDPSMASRSRGKASKIIKFYENGTIETIRE